MRTRTRANFLLNNIHKSNSNNSKNEQYQHQQQHHQQQQKRQQQQQQQHQPNTNSSKNNNTQQQQQQENKIKNSTVSRWRWWLVNFCNTVVGDGGEGVGGGRGTGCSACCRQRRNTTEKAKWSNRASLFWFKTFPITTTTHMSTGRLHVCIWSLVLLWIPWVVRNRDVSSIL